MVYKSPEEGHEVTMIMNGIPEEYKKNETLLENLISEILKEEKFGVLEFSSYHFEPRGFTGMWILSESHATIHTYPEHDSIYFNMYSCRGPNDCAQTCKKILQKILPKNLEYRERKICLKPKKES